MKFGRLVYDSIPSPTPLAGTRFSMLAPKASADVYSLLFRILLDFFTSDSHQSSQALGFNRCDSSNLPGLAPDQLWYVKRRIYVTVSLVVDTTVLLADPPITQ
jgi:hypothetical protein